MSVLATKTWVVLVVTSSLTTLVWFLTRLITPKNAPRPHTPAIATPSNCARFIARQPLSAEIKSTRVPSPTLLDNRQWEVNRGRKPVRDGQRFAAGHELCRLPWRAELSARG